MLCCAMLCCAVPFLCSATMHLIVWFPPKCHGYVSCRFCRFCSRRLLRIEILLTVATFALAIYNLVAGEPLMITQPTLLSASSALLHNCCPCEERPASNLQPVAVLQEQTSSIESLYVSQASIESL